MDARAVRRTIEQLIDSALLIRNRSGVKLQDLQMDYVRLRIKNEQGDINALHARLLNAYNPNRRPWHKIEHDGYLYHHLGYHLNPLNGAMPNLKPVKAIQPMTTTSSFSLRNIRVSYRPIT
jgi:hypothetical protein